MKINYQDDNQHQIETKRVIAQRKMQTSFFWAVVVLFIVFIGAYYDWYEFILNIFSFVAGGLFLYAFYLRVKYKYG